VSPIQTILQAENPKPNSRVSAVCTAIHKRHPDRILGFQYYGSSLRDLDNPEKMLDFYVIVDSYRRVHKNPLRAALNKIIPPAVYYLEHMDKKGVLSTCKYSIISINEFEKRCSSRGFLSMVWGRFSQPSALLFPRNSDVQSRLLSAREAAIRHIANQTAPLLASPINATDFWAQGFYQSYRTELRPEGSVERSAEIVNRYPERYNALMSALYESTENGLYTLPSTSKKLQAACRRRWFFRRLIGKPMSAIRVINNAATFDGGLDYVLRKLHNHSGVTINPTQSQRKHPVLWSPVLGWKLWRKGAFR